MQKFPKNLTDAIKEIKLLRVKVEAEDALNKGWRARCAEAEGKAYAVEKEIKATRDQFADLKERLLNAETEKATLKGYMSRVHEDDVVRDGLVEIEDEQGKRSVPRRPPSHIQHTSHFSGPDMFNEVDTYGRQKKRTHWTDY